MKWAHVAAGVIAAACALSYAAASYAAAPAAEAKLGQPVMRASGGGADAASPPFARPSRGALRFGPVLDRLQSPALAHTRGASDSQVYKRAAPSVVLVVTENGLGSGALISADGQIITNLHVVAGAKQVGVVFKPALDGATVGKSDLRRATVLKIDEITDLALLKVEEAPSGVQPIPLGDSGKLQVGADVHAIGHPTGETWTYTRGVVSQIRRAYEWKTDKIQHEATVIQTQTPINPGNSGGPLLDDQGSLVGVNSFTSQSAEGLHFAVSVEDVKSFLSRARDRTAAPQAAETCEWKDLETADWTDPKGKAYLIDTDCDGQGDTVLIEPKDRRKPTMLMSDESGSGTYDTVYYDLNHDGHPEFVLYDTDGDGKADMQGEFRKGEDEPYRWEKLSN